VEPLTLLRGVREVAARANPADPLAATQRAFDAQRHKSSAPLPAARQITEKLRLSWREVLVVAHAPESRQAQLLGTKTRAQAAQDWLTADHAVTTLQLVAARLGKDSLTTGEYRAERAKLLAADRARWRNGRWLLLPDDEQVITVTGSWDAALRLAGLKTTAERRPAQQQGGAKLADLMERFHDHYGVQPSLRNLQAFALGNGIPYPMRAQPFGVAVAEWVASRRDRGLPAPRVVKRVGGRGHKAPDYSVDVGAARAGERRLTKWTRADCATAVARYLAQLPSSERSTERGYTDWAATQPTGTTPAMSTILTLGGWETTRREALSCRLASEGVRPNSTNLTIMSTPAGQGNPGGQGFEEAAQRASEAPGSGAFDAAGLPDWLRTLHEHATRKSQEIVANHHPYHDHWNDLAGVISEIQPELERYTDAAAHAKDNQGEQFEMSAEESRKKLEGLADTFRDFLKTATAPPPRGL
jgi:hypothetical protein